MTLNAKHVFLFLAVTAVSTFLDLDVLPADEINLPTAAITYKYCVSCPHERFLTRHLCEDCDSLDDAADFCKFMPNPPPRNTVFFAHPRFEVKTYKGDRCGNIDGTKAVVCTQTSDIDCAGLPKYTCALLGDRCFAEHSLATGHLFFAEIYCE